MVKANANTWCCAMSLCISLLTQDCGASENPVYDSICKSCNGVNFWCLGRVASGEELLPVNHLLPGQVSEVPSHVREPLQDALQSVPLSDYSPLDHYCGSFDKLAVCLSCGVHHLRLRSLLAVCIVEPVFLAQEFQDAHHAFYSHCTCRQSCFSLELLSKHLHIMLGTSVQGLVSQSLLRNSTPPHARPTSAPGQTASPVPNRQTTPAAPLQQNAAPDQVCQPAVTKVAAPQAQQVSLY